MTELSANPFQSSGNFTLVKSNPLSLVLKGSDGEAIPVEGLTSPIDILLPRKESLQVPISHWMIKSCYLFESNTSFVRKRTNVELKYCWLVRKPSLLMLRQEHFFACGRLWSLALLFVPQLHGESVKKKKKKTRGGERSARSVALIICARPPCKPLLDLSQILSQAEKHASCSVDNEARMFRHFPNFSRHRLHWTSHKLLLPTDQWRFTKFPFLTTTASL